MRIIQELVAQDYFERRIEFYFKLNDYNLQFHFALMFRKKNRLPNYSSFKMWNYGLFSLKLGVKQVFYLSQNISNYIHQSSHKFNKIRKNDRREPKFIFTRVTVYPKFESILRSRVLLEIQS